MYFLVIGIQNHQPNNHDRGLAADAGRRRPHQRAWPTTSARVCSLKFKNWFFLRFFLVWRGPATRVHADFCAAAGARHLRPDARHFPTGFAWSGLRRFFRAYWKKGTCCTFQPRDCENRNADWPPLPAENICYEKSTHILVYKQTMLNVKHRLQTLIKMCNALLQELKINIKCIDYEMLRGAIFIPHLKDFWKIMLLLKMLTRVSFF